MADARDALAAIGQLPDAEIEIGEAALQLARRGASDDGVAAARHHLSGLAQEMVATAARTGTDLAARALALTGLLADRHGYAGDVETYDDLANADIVRVIERRRGLPVALGIIWLHAAHAAGWPAHGIDFPGHFLVGLQDGDALAVVDVFSGGVLRDREELRAMLRSYEGAEAKLTADHLRPMANRAVLLRLQNNIRLRKLQGGDEPGALACAEDMLRIAPDSVSLLRDVAALQQRLGHIADAMRSYQRLLSLLPDGAAAGDIRATLARLRTRLN
jgi:regulator of sirC expression with transglutaminase-like and TPR domain